MTSENPVINWLETSKKMDTPIIENDFPLDKIYINSFGDISHKGL